MTHTINSGDAVKFYPNDGSAPLPAIVKGDAGAGWFTISVDNTSVEEGTPHRRFETTGRPINPDFDHDRRGLYERTK